MDINYINPIEILGLKENDVKSISSSLIKKSKQRLFADIELSDDGYLNYKGHELTKSDCIKAIDELENENKIEFYSHLANNQLLNNFLANGSSDLLSSFQQHSIYKLPAFVKFVSPYFAAKLNRVLLKAFQNNNEELLSVALRTDQLLTKKDLNKAYKGVSNELQSRIQKIDKITEDINNERTDYTKENIDKVVDVVKQNFTPIFLNTLPDYFQSQINKAADSINSLGNTIWNEFSTTSTPLKLLDHILNLNITSANKPTFKKNYDIVKRKHQERIEQEKNAPVLKKWAKLLIEFKKIENKLEKDESYPRKAVDKVKTLDIEQLNKLGFFANEIRLSITQILRSISISIWNDHEDIKNALFVLQQALTIDIPDEVKKFLRADLKKLKKIDKQKELIGKPVSSPPTLHTINGIGTTIYSDTLYFVILGIPIIPLARYNCEPIHGGYRFYGKLKLHTWQKIWLSAFIIFVIVLIFNSEN